METKRSKLELLQLVKNEYTNKKLVYPFGHKYPGLCAVLLTLWEDRLINLSEYRVMTEYLYEMAPKNKLVILAKMSEYNTYYFWEKYERAPRLRFLNKLIKLQNNV